MKHGQTVICNRCGDTKPLRTKDSAYYNTSCEICKIGEYDRVI